MTFSILIPTLNEEKYIGILLEALAQQTYQDFEVIVVDANSADRTTDVINAFGGRLNVKAYRVTERGKIGMQRNFAASKAKSKYMVFFDADVKPGPGFLQTLKDSVETQDIDFATCWNEPITNKVIDKLMFFAFNTLYLSFVQRFSHTAVGTFIFVRTHAFDAIQGFDEAVVFGEDIDLARRLGRQGYRFGMINGLTIPFSVRRLDKDGRLKYSMKMLKGGVYIYLKGSIKKTGIVRHEFGEYG